MKSPTDDRNAPWARYGGCTLRVALTVPTLTAAQAKARGSEALPNRGERTAARHKKWDRPIAQIRVEAFASARAVGERSARSGTTPI